MDERNDATSRLRAAKRPLWLLTLVFLFAWLAQCTAPIWDWESRALPHVVQTDAVLASESDNGVMSGCESAIYRLSAKTIAGLKASGMAYLGVDTHPPSENPENRYSEWRETPVPVDVDHNGDGTGANTIFALYANGGCNNGSPRQDLRFSEIRRALISPGSYYMLTSNKEGIVLVAPGERLAAYFYFG